MEIRGNNLSNTQIGQTIECLGNPGDSYRPKGSILLRSAFPLLNLAMPSPSHDVIIGNVGSISSAQWQKVIQTSTGVYIAVAATVASPIGRSADGVTWTYPSPGAMANPALYDIVQAGNTLIAVGSYTSSGNPKALILISTDWGLNWTQKVVGLYSTVLQSIAYNGTVVCAIGASDTNYYTSPDQGVTWVQQSGLPINAATVKIRSRGNIFMAISTAQVLNNYWAQFWLYTSPDAITWTTVGLSGGGNTVGTVTPNLSASPDYLIVQVGSNFYRTSDGAAYTLFDPAISTDTVLGRAKVFPSIITYAAGRYLALGTSKLTDSSGNALKLDILLISGDCDYWYGIQLKSLPDALIFAGSGNSAVGIGKAAPSNLTFTFDPTRVVLDIITANQYVRVK